MNNFYQSWAFWFLLGCFAVAVIVFILWVICAAGSKGSRAEEELIYEAARREKKRRGEPKIEIVTQNNPRTD